MKNLKTEREKGMKWGGHVILSEVLQEALKNRPLSKSRKGEGANLQPLGGALRQRTLQWQQP